MAEQLETGYLPTTPIGDSVLRQFLYNQADLNAVTATASGGTAEQDDEVAMADAAGPIAFFNQSVLLRPLMDVADPLLDRVEAFHRSDGPRPATLLSAWPTPDLTSRDWHLVGHPAFVVRAPAPVPGLPPEGVVVDPVRTPAQLAVAERILVEGFPIDEVIGAPPGTALAPALLDTEPLLRIGSVDGEPVALGGRHIAHGVVNLFAAATLPAARRRGVWRTIVAARIGDAPDLPAVAFTSDYSRPGFQRMGFLVLCRFALWHRLG